MVTIEDVARRAGLSVATVSRALNGSSRVRPGTAKRVLKAAEELSYSPNRSARNLRKRESRVILVLAPNFSNPFYSSILTGIGDAANSEGYSVLICNTASKPERELNYLKMLSEHRADGAIVLGMRKTNKAFCEFVKEGQLLMCCEYVPDVNFPSVSIDNYAAAFETVSYLISLGHERIAMLSANNDYISTVLRRQGYEEALRSAGIEVRSEYFSMADADYSYNSGLRAAEELLSAKQRPTAVFCVSDILALSTISVAGDKGLRVPEDLSVTGFDDVDYTTMFHPHLSTVSQPCYEMGVKSLLLLTQMLSGEKQLKGDRVFLPYSPTIRESTAELRQGK